MSQANTMMIATGGRDASRERRTQLVQGKTALPPAASRLRLVQGKIALPPAASRLRADQREAAVVVPQADAPNVAQSAPVPVSGGGALTGRDASRMRRAGLVQGKSGLRQQASVPATAALKPQDVSAVTLPDVPVMSSSGRQIAQALRGSRARNGRDNAGAVRPSGRATGIIIDLNLFKRY